ncbi:MAG TPA: zinc ribbon domain-containing protein [Chthoniobacterales bacterium]|nr:zinc ribbon domain-containing protein [Chthoniobacterales bacterium]
MIKLVCPECQRQNEPERIYCHDCGARLDRSALAKVAPKGEDPKETHRRLHKLFDPGRVKMRLLFFKISKLVLGAASLAVLIEMLLPPREAPERVKNIELQQINLDLENAIATRSAVPLQYTDAQVNDYLVNVVKNKHAALSKFLEFERAFVKFDEGVCQITAERSLLGFSVFHAISYRVALKDGTVTTATNGGSIGRMPIHPMIMKYGDILFTDLWAALERDKKTVSKMAVIEFHPKKVSLSAKSAGAAPVESPPEATPAPDSTPAN